ncbi:type II secretion system F family protein [Microcella alkaliphila]|uniref:Putative type IV fimbrial assembly protein PilC n=1 Tax=Microcella alkaliphila TaxID=279828 RepID=A0A0U5B5Z3_9MICO|nr:type II secretion system F family protein [Microcella alkaliphila]BAU31344.1 putative type IV fimbrial assembly protein PilC [Microcella alkaliphila]
MATALTFSYRGKDATGKKVTGVMDGPSEAIVSAKLRAQGVTPESVRQAGTGLNAEINLGGLFKKKVGLKDLAVMSRQLATMISSGLALLKALTILSEQSENELLRETLDQVRKDVEQGLSLSEAIAKHDTIFPPLFINLVRAGETGGFLESSLQSVAENYEKEVKLRGTIKSALTYPIVVLIMAIVGVIGMIVFIVPVFKNMFEGLGGTLPAPTQFLVVLSETAIYWLPILVISLVVFSVWWGKNKHQPRVREVVDPLKLKMPVFGPLMTKIAIARFTRNFGTMMRSGVPILQALSIVGATSGNYVIEKALINVQESVRQGRSIAAPLADEPIFPQMVTQMIAVGEDSGSLETMLEKVSDFYDAEVESTTEQLTALIEPLMIAFMGVLLGGMILALYLPVFNIFTLI